MIKFLLNLFKVIIKKKPKDVGYVKSFTSETKQDVMDRLNKERNVKWIKNGLGVERTKKGVIIHSVDYDGNPEDMMDMIADLLRKGEI